MRSAWAAEISPAVVHRAAARDRNVLRAPNGALGIVQQVRFDGDVLALDALVGARGGTVVDARRTHGGVGAGADQPFGIAHLGPGDGEVALGQRLAAAVVVAIRAGIGRHPGLALHDAPMGVGDLAGLGRERLGRADEAGGVVDGAALERERVGARDAALAARMAGRVGVGERLAVGVDGHGATALHKTGVVVQLAGLHVDGGGRGDGPLGAVVQHAAARVDRQPLARGLARDIAEAAVREHGLDAGLQVAAVVAGDAGGGDLQAPDDGHHGTVAVVERARGQGGAAIGRERAAEVGCSAAYGGAQVPGSGEAARAVVQAAGHDGGAAARADQALAAVVEQAAHAEREVGGAGRADHAALVGQAAG